MIRPAELADNVAKARALKHVNTIEITLEPKKRAPADDHGFRDFSREGIETRRVARPRYRAFDAPPRIRPALMVEGSGAGNGAALEKEPHESLE